MGPWSKAGVLAGADEPRFADVPQAHIVPKLADAGECLASTPGPALAEGIASMPGKPVCTATTPGRVWTNGPQPFEK